MVITDVTTKEANDYETNFGKLVRVEGEVIDYTLAGGIVESITVQDDSGESCRVFIDGYIGYSDETSQALEDFVAEGAYISAVGFVSHDAEGNRLRVRDRSEILPAEPGEEPAPGGDQPGTDEPGTDQPGDDQPGTDVPGTDQPGSGQQGGNTQTGGSQTGNGAQQGGSAVKNPGSAAQTGDNASVGIRIAIAVTAVLAAGAAAVVIVVGKRRRQRES